MYDSAYVLLSLGKIFQIFKDYDKSVKILPSKLAHKLWIAMISLKR